MVQKFCTRYRHTASINFFYKTIMWYDQIKGFGENTTSFICIHDGGHAPKPLRPQQKIHENNKIYYNLNNFFSYFLAVVNALLAM